MADSGKGGLLLLIGAAAAAALALRGKGGATPVAPVSPLPPPSPSPSPSPLLTPSATGVSHPDGAIGEVVVQQGGQRNDERGDLLLGTHLTPKRAGDRVDIATVVTFATKDFQGNPILWGYSLVYHFVQPGSPTPYVSKVQRLNTGAILPATITFFQPVDGAWALGPWDVEVQLWADSSTPTGEPNGDATAGSGIRLGYVRHANAFTMTDLPVGVPLPHYQIGAWVWTETSENALVMARTWSGFGWDYTVWTFPMAELSPVLLALASTPSGCRPVPHGPIQYQIIDRGAETYISGTPYTGALALPDKLPGAWVTTPTGHLAVIGLLRHVRNIDQSGTTQYWVAWIYETGSVVHWERFLLPGALPPWVSQVVCG